MPRFDEEAVKVLKQQMVKRLPECYFTQADIDELMTETGLNAAQIMQWSDNLRFRIPVQTEREATLRDDESFNKVT
jgi:hypothetical protein